MHHPRLLSSAIALATAVLLTPTQATAADQSHTLNIGITGEPASLDPAKASGGVWESDVFYDLYSGLIVENAKGEHIPGVAKSWEVSDDGLTYTFHLRDDAKWSDGQPVTAEDFVFGWQHQLDPKSASKYAYMLYPVKNAKAVNTGKKPLDALGVKSLDDGHTFQVTLAQPTPYFIKILTHYTSLPVPKHVVKKYGDQWTQMDHIVTDGAFKPTNWISHDHITAVRNPDFYDAKDVSLEQINYYPTEDANAGVQRYRAGELDILRNYTSDRYDWLKKNLPQATHMDTYLGSYYYVLNSRDGRPTADPRVREALNLAIRRNVLSEQIMNGTFKPAYALVPPGVSHYDAQPMALKGMSMDERMKKAKQLMQDAGYGPDHPLKLMLRYNTNDEHKKIAIAVAAMWRPLGVQVEMTNAEVTVHYQALQEGDFDVGRAGWIADYNDAENFLTLLHTGVGNNYGAYHSEQFDQLMDKANVTLDNDKREKLMEQAESVAMNDYALIPLLYYVSRNLVNPKLKGWHDNIEDNHPSRWVKFSQ
ncbi:peptide ABC transporter substrate-binding protein [Kushneria phosphatilytica]|uniref:Peptide ABC transporter substrate-binding protein n=1 Tax=Kushneria phosphatilytica TaxID=657387 RepID=A0A1S1NVU2_9GAMM|nr:peptide ABC transporter substrate-binding protein [Kushneria phosphatilytica]OHV10893.1 peptide ABC transporter substrate-binding protein [Kushneria phosphatilytica]QEL12022.1 peptide ABC transporter substrate-binding protein [Kushneria phosphatilytica]